MKEVNLTSGSFMSQFIKNASYNFKGLTFWQLVLVNVYMILALFFFTAVIYMVFTEGFS